MVITATGNLIIWKLYMSLATIISTGAKGKSLIESGAGCSESGTSGSNREGRKIILPLDPNLIDHQGQAPLRVT